jgi:predicted transcriptional regulator
MVGMMPVSAAAIPPPIVHQAGQAVRDGHTALRAARVVGAPVIDVGGAYLGTLATYRLGQVIEETS